MKRERLFRVKIKELEQVTVDYYLTIDEASEYEKYGVCLVKVLDGDLIEEFATVDHVCHERDEAQRLIERLAQGEAMPVSLSDIIDDYLVQRG